MVGEVVWVNQDELVERHLLQTSFQYVPNKVCLPPLNRKVRKTWKRQFVQFQHSVCSVFVQFVQFQNSACSVCRDISSSFPVPSRGQYPLPGSHTKKRNQKINWNIEWNMGANEFHPLLKWSICVLSETGWIWFIGDILTYQTFFNGRPFLWSLRQPAFISDPPT